MNWRDELMHVAIALRVTGFILMFVALALGFYLAASWAAAHDTWWSWSDFGVGSVFVSSYFIVRVS
jgi:hypothetical protein